MNRRSILPWACVALLCPSLAWPADSPEAAVVLRAMDAMNHGRIDAFVADLHPDTVSGFQKAILLLSEDAAKRGKEADLLKSFKGVSSVQELKSLPAPRMVAVMFDNATADPEAKAALASTKLDILGQIAEGKDRSYVAFESRMKYGELDIDRLSAVALLRSGQDWKISFNDELSGQLLMMQRAIGGDFTLPDPSSAKVEPLGRILQGRKKAFVVYRSSMPLGNSAITKLAVQGVKSGDPGWDEVRKDDKAGMKKLIETILGVH